MKGMAAVVERKMRVPRYLIQGGGGSSQNVDSELARPAREVNRKPAPCGDPGK